MIISVRGIAKLLGTSITSAQRFLKELMDREWIYLKEVKKKIGAAMPIDGKPNGVKLGYFYNYKGELWYSLGSAIMLLH